MATALLGLVHSCDTVFLFHISNEKKQLNENNNIRQQLIMLGKEIK